MQLREQFQAAQKQANDYAAAQTQLDEQIFNLERQMETASRTTRTSATRWPTTGTTSSRAACPRTPSRSGSAAEGTVVSPDIEGKVLRVEPQNELIEFSLGEDDGVVTGQEYFVFRTGDAPQYIGKIRVTLTEADKAVGRVVDRYLGRKVMEGDNVSAKIRPRELRAVAAPSPAAAAAARPPSAGRRREPRDLRPAAEERHLHDPARRRPRRPAHRLPLPRPEAQPVRLRHQRPGLSPAPGRASNT